MKNVSKILAGVSILALIAAVLTLSRKEATGESEASRAPRTIAAATNANVRSPARAAAVASAAKSLARPALARDERKIKLQSRVIDLPDGKSFPSEFCRTQTPSSRGTAPYVIACRRTPAKATRERVAALGARVLGYIPNNSLIVETDASTLAKLSAEPELVAAVEFEPQDKLAPKLREQLATASGDVEVTVFTLADEDVETVKSRVLAAGGTIVPGAIHDHDFFTVSVKASEIDNLIASADVRWLEGWSRPQFVNDRICYPLTTNADPVRGANAARGYNLTGAGQKILVMDSGLDVSGWTNGSNVVNADLRDRQFGEVICYGQYESGGVTYNSVPWDSYGHGTHVSGTICGTGANSSGLYQGVAPGAKMRMLSTNGPQAGGVYFSKEYSLLDAYVWSIDEDQYHIHSDSWGTLSTFYDGHCIAADTAMWSNRTFLVVAAAGNDGAEGAMSLHTPGGAKNTLCVGSSRNYRSNKIDMMTGDHPELCSTISQFSSRGPMDDGRIKPDICAPGETVTSVLSALSGWSINALESNPKYVVCNGTSMATPTAAGNVALLREWLIKYRGYTDPTAALLKAMLCGGAVDLFYEKETNPAPTAQQGDYATGPVPSCDQGWGRINLADTIAPTNGLAIYLADELPFAPETNFVFQITTTKRAPLSVQLSWVDAPAKGTALTMLVNDLDLTVTAVTNGTDETVWYGNGGAAPDELNNNESVRIAEAPAAVYTVSVTCPRIVYDYLEGGAAALYVRGAFDASAVVSSEGEADYSEMTTVEIVGTPSGYETYRDDVFFYGVTNVPCRSVFTVYPKLVEEEECSRVALNQYILYSRAKGSVDDWEVLRAKTTITEADRTDGISWTVLSSLEYRLEWIWAEQLKHIVRKHPDSPNDLYFTDNNSDKVATNRNELVIWRTPGSQMWLTVGGNATTATNTLLWTLPTSAEASDVSLLTSGASVHNRLTCTALKPLTLYVKEIPGPTDGSPMKGLLTSVGDPANLSVEDLPEYFTDREIEHGTNLTFRYSANDAVPAYDDGPLYTVYGYRTSQKWLDGNALTGAVKRFVSASSIANSFTYTQQGATENEIIWLWTNAVHVSIQLNGGATMRVNGSYTDTNRLDRYFAIGDTVTFSAENSYLYDWSGLPPSIVKDPTSEYYTLEITEDLADEGVDISAETVLVSTLTVYSEFGRFGDEPLDLVAPQVGALPEYGSYKIEVGTSRTFEAPTGKTVFPDISENLRFYVTGYYPYYAYEQKAAGVTNAVFNVRTGRYTRGLVAGTSFTFNDGGKRNSNNTLAWRWEMDGAIAVCGADSNTQVSFDGETWGGAVTNWYPLGSTIALSEWADESDRTNHVITIYGGTNTTSTYEWEGLPTNAVFTGEDDNRRIATFTAGTLDFYSNLTTVVVREVSSEPEPEPEPTPEEQTYPFADQETISVVVFGNSYTHYLANSFRQNAEAMGKKVRYAHAFFPYGSFTDHWTNRAKENYCDLELTRSSGTEPFNNIDVKSWTMDGVLTNGNWDIVALISSPDELYYPWTSDWSSGEKASYTNLVMHIHEQCPTAKIYLCQLWPYGIYCSKLFTHSGKGLTIQTCDPVSLRDQQYERTVQNYDWAYHAFDNVPELQGVVEKIIPSGYAQILYNYRRPLITWDDSVQLQAAYDANFHPSDSGYAFQGLTWLRAIFGQLPEKENLASATRSLFDSFGTDIDTVYECIEDACKAAHTRYCTYREPVDFRYRVTIRNYDGTQIGEVQSVTNRGCAVLPDPATINVGEGYEFSGWTTAMDNHPHTDYADPYSDNYQVYTDAEMRGFKIFDTTDIIVHRKLVGEAGPERTWTGYANDNKWETPENWEPELVPDAESDVTIPYPADATNTLSISISTAITNSSLTVGSGSGLGQIVLSFNVNDFAATNRFEHNVTLNSNAVITCRKSGQTSRPAYVSSLNYRVTMDVGGNLTINKGAMVDVMEKGYPPGTKVTGYDADPEYPGACGYSYKSAVKQYWSGSHGGIGGQAYVKPYCTSTNYPCYGSIRRPLELGASGNSDFMASGGGGAVHLIAGGYMTIDGDIRASGSTTAINYGSGAGGSVWLEASTFTGTGTVDVRGGVTKLNAVGSQSCGGSGRIAIYTKEAYDHIFSVAHEGEVINLLAGPRKSKNETETEANYHGCGTIYIETSEHQPGHGVLYIDGGGVGTAGREYAAQIGSLVEEANDTNALFEAIVLQNRGRLYMQPGSYLFTRALTIRGDDTLSTCTDSAYDPTLGTVVVGDDPVIPTPTPVHEHVYGDYAVVVAATCTNTGYEVAVCTNGCELTPPAAVTNVLAALGHDWGNWYTNVAPAVGTAGELRRDCLREGCGVFETQVLEPLPEPEDPDPEDPDPEDPDPEDPDPEDPNPEVDGTNWISNVKFDGTDTKWGTLPAGAEFADNRLVMTTVGSEIAYPGTRPIDVTKTNLTVQMTARFVPYNVVPDVDPEAKGGVVVLANGAATNYWILAKKSGADENEWIDSGLPADTEGDVLVRIVIATAKGVTTASYGFADATPVAKAAYAPSEANRVALLGSGELSALEGWFGEASPSPEPTVITVAFALGTGVLSANYALAGEAAVAVTNNQTVGFEENASFTVAANADTNNWYRITGGTGEYVADVEKTVSITASSETPASPTPADYGLAGPFADAKPAEVKKVMDWAKTHGKTPSQMSSLDFTNEVGQTEKAYLFNVADTPDAVDAAEKAFRFPSIEPGTVPTVDTLVPPNGTVGIEGANTLVPVDWTSPATGTHKFYRATLTK